MAEASQFRALPRGRRQRPRHPYSSALSRAGRNARRPNQPPALSADVWVWPKATPQAAQVGAGSKISRRVDREREAADDFVYT